MAVHHAYCDDLFAKVQAQISEGRWDVAASDFKRFRDELQHHMLGEETVLFAAFEAATGIQSGPTAMMRQEHERMRALLEQIELALAARDADRIDGYVSTLLIMMQQHNLKEENILYPKCDAALADSATQIVSRLDLSALRRA